jgi:excisionase family DNA binding protein
MINMSRKMYTVNEAAELLHINSEVMRRWLRSGKIVGTKVSNRWLISGEAIDALLHGRGNDEEEESDDPEYESCVCFPRWIEFSGLPGLITQKYGPACWNVLRCIIELDCQFNETPGQWVKVSIDSFVMKSGLPTKQIEKCLKELKKDKYLTYKKSFSNGFYETKLATPIKTPITVFEIDHKHGGLKNSNTDYTNNSCVLRYTK